mgnify:CR=1 FL=1
MLSTLSVAQIQILCHGAALGIFFSLGHFSQRYTQSLIRRDTLVNVGTGLGILVVIKPLMVWLNGILSIHLISLESLHPVLQFLLAFLLLDFTRYWLHYMHHRVSFFWQFHRVHHSSATLDSTSGLRMHLFDFIQLALLPTLLFSTVFDIRTWSEWMLPSVLLVGTFFDAFQHANLRFNIAHPMGKIWHKLLNNPHFHAWHHVRDAQGQDGNYGNVLLVWDRLFGTEVTQDHLPETLGLNQTQALNTSDPISLQLLRRPTS